MDSNNPTVESGFVDDFEHLQNVSEMVVETSGASKDQQSESATSGNNMCTCTCSESADSGNNICMCTCRICNLISAEKATLQRKKCMAML